MVEKGPLGQYTTVSTKARSETLHLNDEAGKTHALIGASLSTGQFSIITVDRGRGVIEANHKRESTSK